ncbi:alkaline phosphatase family protein [Amycolatopsis pigmentata]|uniref:phospholipase C n=1 Tax=Amycolatopsis pigmentata TaxID=450801 RepID=A0ABW5G664_9PSEU
MAALNRRVMLKTGVAAAGAAAIAALPPNLRKMLAASPAAGELSDIRHIVVLMQENRSFDHYFGTLPGVRGFDDPDAITLSTGRSVFHQPDPGNPAGYLLPFHLDTRTSSAQAIPSTSHAFSVQHAAWNNGKMDNWLPAHRKADGNAYGPYTMGYYTRDDIPFHFALAEAFAVCDAYHSSVLGPTWPNRLYLMSGTIDPAGANGGPVISNAMTAPFSWTTYPERLTDAGVSWHVYQEEDDFGCNVLEFFDNFQNSDSRSPLYRHGMTIGPADQFDRDAREDRLPTVSWVIPTASQCEHPDYLPAAGEDFVARKLDAIAANPDVWRKTVVIVTYDENDGLFDHVPPPTPPPGTEDEFVGGLPIGAGFRVPCVIVSPWTQGGWVARERFDHTSILRFMELCTGVREPNISAWRRETFGDLTSVLGQSAGRPFPDLPKTKDHFRRAERDVETLPHLPLPGADQVPPHQEPSGRPPVPAAPRATSIPVARPRTPGRVLETLTTHRADFPRGVAGAGFPGIPVAAFAAAGAAKSTASHAYVTMLNSYSVGVIDTGTYKLVKAIHSGANPYGIVAAPDGSKIFVTSSGGDSVSVVDPSADKLIGTLKVGQGPHGIALSPDGRTAYVAASDADIVSVLEVAAGKAVGSVAGEIRTGSAPRAVAVSSGGAKLFVAGETGLSIVDTASRMVRTTLPSLARANGLTVAPDGRHLYLTLPWEDAIAVLDTVSDKVVGRIACGRAPWQVAVRPDGAFAYAANANENTVSVIDTGRMAVVDTVPVGHVPTGIRVTADTLWVATNASSTVQAVTLGDLRVAATIPLGLSSQPASIAVV